MIVCSCTGVTDRDVRSLACEGRCSLDDVVRACDAGGGCGGCRDALETILRAASESRTPASDAVELATTG